MIIAIDFDGTCVTHEFPKVGKDINAVPVLKALVENGHQLVLFTMRSDIVNPTGEDNELHLESGNYLTDAVNWFKENEIPLYGIQTNPTQHTWTTSPKAYAQRFAAWRSGGFRSTYFHFSTNVYLKTKCSI